MSQTMQSCIPALKTAMKKMDAHGIGNSVTEFEKVFEDMAVKSGEMDAVLDNIYAESISTDEVSNLL